MTKERKQEITQIENKLLRREDNLNFRDETLTQKEQQIDHKNNQLTKKLSELDEKEKKLQEKIDAFKQGKYDIMLGTQMVAKGLNFPNLQLVGVILADTGLHLPDFRAAERTFSLIT